MKAILLGDAMIPGKGFGDAWKKHMSKYGEDIIVDNWESDWGQLQYRRLEVEKRGPEIETVDETILKEGKDAEALMGLFVPVSSKVMDAMPNLRIVGVSRAGLENVNVEEATKRGVLVFNVKGRNAHAVSDYKTIGLVGFGYIGKLVAKKLSGFDVNIVVYDPYTDASVIEAAGAKKVELDELMSTSDFVSIHARLTDQNKNMIGAHELGLMKPTAYFINTGRAGLVDQEALANALAEQKIMGAALDVFTTEPIPADSPFLKLDNVTLTTHIAGTTSEALTNSPYLLMEDVAKFLNGEEAHFIVNKEVLENEDFKAWLAKVRG